MSKVVVITGSFDPIHTSHIDYIKSVSKLGEVLVVGVNSDEWLVRKKGQSFMPFEDRVRIVQEIKEVDYAIPFDDRNDSFDDIIAWTRRAYPTHTIVFVNSVACTANIVDDHAFELVQKELMFKEKEK